MTRLHNLLTSHRNKQLITRLEKRSGAFSIMELVLQYCTKKLGNEAIEREYRRRWEEIRKAYAPMEQFNCRVSLKLVFENAI